MSLKLRSSLMLLLAAFIWGTAFVAQSIGMDYIGPHTFGGIRFIIGGIVLLPLIAYRTKHGQDVTAKLAASTTGKPMNSQLENVLIEVEKAVAGKREVIKKLIMALLADGHVLLDDVPGVGKTTLSVALSRAVGLSFKRVQFTPDVLPSDIVGFSMYDKNSGDFVYRPGAVNRVNLLLGDEINRTSSKTQSALLEAALAR